MYKNLSFSDYGFLKISKTPFGGEEPLWLKSFASFWLLL